jgi:hypothetical protein
MKYTLGLAIGFLIALASNATPVMADWNFNSSPSPKAFLQTDKMTLEVQCDRIRFSPASYQDAQDIEAKQGLSIVFMKDGSTEADAFQAGATNSTIQIVDNYPVEIIFSDRADFDFVVDQIAQNAVLNLSKIDEDISYGVFELKGSGLAVKSLRSSCGSGTKDGSASTEAPEGIVYCGGGQVKRQIEYAILENTKDQWNARVTINGQTIKAMTAYSYFGNSPVPAGFVVALLGEDRSEMLVFRQGNKDWLEFGDYTYRKCN